MGPFSRSTQDRLPKKWQKPLPRKEKVLPCMVIHKHLQNFFLTKILARSKTGGLVFQEPDEFVEPNYLTVGSTTMNGGFYIELHECSLCGSVVLDRAGHSEWHAQLWVVLKKER